MSEKPVDYMRRCDVQRMTDVERKLRDAMMAIEALPAADIRLTEAMSLLAAARIRLADYVDGTAGHSTLPVQPHLVIMTPRVEP